MKTSEITPTFFLRKMIFTFTKQQKTNDQTVGIRASSDEVSEHLE